MIRRIAISPVQPLLLLACCLLLSAFSPRTFHGQSGPGEQQSSQPFSHNRCDWLPESTFSEAGYTNDVLGLAYKVPDGWRADSKFLAGVNWTTFPPPRPTDPDAARIYDSAMRVKSCTLVAISKISSQAASSRYPRVEIDLSTDPDDKGGMAAKDILQRVSAMYKKNPALKTISEVQEVQVGGMNFLQLDAELLAQGGGTHYFHRSLVSPAVNLLALTVRITATSLEDLGTATETLNSLRIDRTRFNLPPRAQQPSPSMPK